MITPTKHEDLSSSSLVVGSTLLKILKRKNLVLEDMYTALKDKHGITLEVFFDVVLFLWLAGFIEVNRYEMRLKRAGQ